MRMLVFVAALDPPIPDALTLPTQGRPSLPRTLRATARDERGSLTSAASGVAVAALILRLVARAMAATRVFAITTYALLLAAGLGVEAVGLGRLRRRLLAVGHADGVCSMHANAGRLAADADDESWWHLDVRRAVVVLARVEVRDTFDCHEQREPILSAVAVG
jgi:hypothetical protein